MVDRRRATDDDKDGYRHKRVVILQLTLWA